MIDFEGYKDIVESCSRSAARISGSEFHVWEDINQSVWEDLLTANIWNEEFENRDHVLKKYIKWRANFHAERERNDYMYFRGNYVYTSDEVKKMLQELSDDPTTIDSVDEHVDINAAIRHLTTRRPAQARIIVKRYIEDRKLSDSERVREWEAVEFLTNYLNRRSGVYDSGEIAA